MAFAKLEPFGEQRADLRMAIQAALLANIHRDKKRRSEPYKPADFMPFPEDEQERTVQSLIQKLRAAEPRTVPPPQPVAERGR
jgi:hypothetical protein